MARRRGAHAVKGARSRIFNYRCQRKRKEQRQELGSLRKLVISQQSENRYFDALVKFFNWMKKEKMQVGSNGYTLDDQFREYLCWLWEEGESRSWASYALAGAQHFSPEIRRQIPAAWRLLGAWQKHEVPVRAPPLSWIIVEAMAWIALRNQRTDIAVALMIMFGAFLRPVEILELCASDCVVSVDFSQVVLNLGRSKTGARMGFEESTILDDPVSVLMLRAWLSRAMPGDMLLPRGALEFRKCFSRLLEVLQLQDIGYKPYSLRRGGATAFFRKTGNMSLTCLRGRWSSEKTARIYVNEAMAHLTELAMPDSAFRAVRQFSGRLRDMVSQ